MKLIIENLDHQGRGIAKQNEKVYNNILFTDGNGAAVANGGGGMGNVKSAFFD